jgi:hypothetical protein
MSEPDYLDDDQFLAEYLDLARQKFEAGNKTIILMAMHQCLLMDKRVPEWLRLAFIEAYQSATAFNIRSWDEAFGPPQEKGTHLNTRKKYAELRYDIAMGVALRPPGKIIDKELFEAIGRDLSISGTTASEIYYDHGGKDLCEMLEPIVPWMKSKN